MGTHPTPLFLCSILVISIAACCFSNKINKAPCSGCWLTVWLRLLMWFFCLKVFLDLTCCGNDDAQLWSSALLESVIIPSGQSVWHSAVAFQSPPPAPWWGTTPRPPSPPTKADHTEQTCLYLRSSPFVLFHERLPPTSAPNRSQKEGY